MKQPIDSDEVSIVVSAPAERVYELVADVTRMPELSPELLECRWLDGVTEPVVGARFTARNKVARGPSWGNKPVITALEPGRYISWARSEPFAGTVEWSYRFDPRPDGTVVTERYEVIRPITRLGWLIITTMSPGDRQAQLRDGMEQTLQRLRTAAEAT